VKRFRSKAPCAAMKDPSSNTAWVGRVAAVLALSALAGCSTLSSWIPPPPSFNWFGSDKKLGPLPPFTATVTPRVVWQQGIGKAGAGIEPAVQADAIYAASKQGTVVRLNAATGASAWRAEAAKQLSAGVGADASIIAVGTDKGDVIAFTADGKPAWQVKVTSEVVSPPKIGDGVVVVWSGDGRVFGLSATDGKTRWVYQRNNPPLTVRNYSGGVITRGGLFMGTAGGKLVAVDLTTGNLGWEANVATPKGATELERIADVTSLPLIDGNQACAVAYQGRIACFDLSARNAQLVARRVEPRRPRRRFAVRLHDRRQGRDSRARQDHGRFGVEAGQARAAEAGRTADRRRRTSPSSMAKAMSICSTPTTATWSGASPPTARRPRPSRADPATSAVWQSTGGAVFSVSAR
jgi:outer membrane assembly lipoprotein YfgL